MFIVHLNYNQNFLLVFFFYIVVFVIVFALFFYLTTLLFTIISLLFATLLLLLSHLVVLTSCLVVCTLLVCHHALLLCLVVLPYWLMGLAALPSRFGALPCQLLIACHYYSPFLGTSYTLPTLTPIVVSLLYCSLSHLAAMPCQLVLLPRSFMQVEELGAKPTSFIKQQRFFFFQFLLVFF